jgi:hypothetical protein
MANPAYLDSACIGGRAVVSIPRAAAVRAMSGRRTLIRSEGGDGPPLRAGQPSAATRHGSGTAFGTPGAWQAWAADQVPWGTPGAAS